MKKMSLDHEDVERIENIEDKIRTIEQHLDNISGTKLLNEVSQLHSKIVDIETKHHTDFEISQTQHRLQNKMNDITKKNIDNLIQRNNDIEGGLQTILKEVTDHLATIEQRLDKMDEARKKQLQNINEQMVQTIDKLPMGVRGIMKKIVEGKNGGNGGERDV